MPWNYHIICVRSTKVESSQGLKCYYKQKKGRNYNQTKKLNLQTLAGIPAGEQLIVDLKLGLSCCFLSRQRRAGRNKSFHKPDSCCFQVQLLSPSHLLLQTAREQLSLAPGDFHRSGTWLNQGSLCILTHWHSQHHSNTFSLCKSTVKCPCAWASLREFLRRLWWLSTG